MSQCVAGIGSARAWWQRAAVVSLSCVSVVALAAQAGADVPIGRRWASSPPTVDGVISPGEWSTGWPTAIAHGQIRTMNDASFLYVLVDVVDDTVNDPIGTVGGNEFFTLAFDTDLSFSVTPHVDLAYASCQNGVAFVKAYYLGGGAFTGCQTPSPLSLGQPGFGPTLNSATPHRFWEFRLDLAEIGVDPTTWTTSSGDTPHVRVNVGVGSDNPAFIEGSPDPNVYPDLHVAFRLDLATYPLYPPGTAGPTFAGVGLVPSSYIDSLGYATLNIPNYYSATDAPFGGNLNVFTDWNTLYNVRGARSYRVYYSKDGGPATQLLQTWTNFRYISGNWVATAFGPDSLGRYPVPNPAAVPWYLTNLLISWQTGLFPDGSYRLALQLFDGAGNPLPAPPGNLLTLFVTNSPPSPVINGVTYSGDPVCACAIVTQGDVPGSGFRFNLSVSDPNGALDGFSLGGIFGNNQNTGTIYSDTYASHVDADGPNRWNGVSGITVPATPFQASQSCAYSFLLHTWSRAQNGYARLFGDVVYTTSFTILEGTGLGSIAGCGALASSTALGGQLSQCEAPSLSFLPDPRRLQALQREPVVIQEGGGTLAGLK
jgi:hypothetical protein